MGGWQINQVSTWYSGLPFTPYYSNCGSDRDVGPCRPGVVGEILQPHSRDLWFQVSNFRLENNGDVSGPWKRPDVVGPILQPHDQNLWFQVATTALSSNGAVSGPWKRPAVESFGNVGRNPLTGPSFFDTDLSLFKNFSITERFRGQFRAEAFNLFNIVNLNNPDSCIDCNPKSAGRIFGLRQGYQIQMRRFQFALKFNF